MKQTELKLYQNVAIVIPAFNESSQILKTLSTLRNFFDQIYVVDDGSSDSLFEIVRANNIICVRHPINLGQGAAIQSGIDFALKNPKIQYILTFDADGQHSVSDAMGMIEVISREKVEIVLGSRFLQKKVAGNIPQKKKLILKLGIIFTRISTGLKVTDTHNGLRIMTRSFAKNLCIKQSGMAHASEILEYIKKTNAKWIEHPVTIEYNDYAVKKGQSVFNAINILTEMLHK